MEVKLRGFICIMGRKNHLAILDVIVCVMAMFGISSDAKNAGVNHIKKRAVFKTCPFFFDSTALQRPKQKAVSLFI
ncbi:MAG: hypothetical protein ACLSFI_09080 [Christensenellaceae bacterium]|jgi:hypothetical protein|nr:hypothetical protein [Candidatus Scybalosoma faecavium]